MHVDVHALKIFSSKWLLAKGEGILQRSISNMIVQ